jgi:hypothetical protein
MNFHLLRRFKFYFRDAVYKTWVRYAEASSATLEYLFLRPYPFLTKKLQSAPEM